MTTRLLVIDLPNLAMRCAFGGQRPVAQSTPTTLGMLARHIAWAQPTHVVCALDGEGPSVRKALADTYKRDRTVQTRPYVEAAQVECERRGWACVSVPGYEADDLLAVFATHAQVDEVYLLTGDSDALTLVTDGSPGAPRVVRAVVPANAQGTPKVYDPALVCAEYGLHYPWQVSHHKALMSEPGDGVVGVHGIGEKRAAALLRAHGTVEGVIAAGEQPGAGRWEKLVADHAPTARLAYRLVDLVADLDLDPDFKHCGDVLRLSSSRRSDAKSPATPAPSSAAEVGQLSLL